MKKSVLVLLLLFLSGIVHAQDQTTPYIDNHVFNVGVSILILGLVMAFILKILKLFLDQKLKEKLIENGVTEDIASTILQEDKPSPGGKWALLFTGIGIALLLIRATSPLGIHSLAILSFCLAGVFFLSHFLFSPRNNSK